MFAKHICVLAVFGMVVCVGAARATRIDFSTTAPKAGTHWRVSKVSHDGTGKIWTRKPAFTTCGCVKVPVMTLPFKHKLDDGWWSADTYFELPAGFSSAQMEITQCGADDRMILLFNGTIILSCGINSPGPGAMQLTDPGSSKSYTFVWDGKHNAIIQSGFLTGSNHLQVIINNTGKGIAGPIEPGGPTWFLLKGNVSYTKP